MIEKRDVSFQSEGVNVAGWLFLPERTEGQAPLPAVAMAHGLGAVKEMYLEQFGRRFAEEGVATLIFDYRYMGASGGTPRQRIHPRDQMEDYRSALTWLSLQPEIDAERLGIWGTSFSGGHVLHVAAHDPRVKAVVSQVGAMDPNRIVRTAAGPEGFAQMGQLIAQERVRKATEGGEAYIPNTGHHGEGFALQTDEEGYDWMMEAHATVAPSWRNEVTMGSLEAILEHRPALSIDLISPRPLLMILADNDPSTPPDTIREAFARAGAPKKLIEIEGSHYSAYGERAPEASTAAALWFAEHL